MKNIDIKDICFIRAKLKNDYVVNGREMKGYRNIIPYKDYNLLMRVIREIWFKTPLPRNIWYNSQIKNIRENNIIIFDPLITSDIVSYIVKLYPDRQIYLCYENRADNTINPDSIKEKKVIKCTYDKSDSARYHMHYIEGGYQDVYRFVNSDNKLYDIVYVGRDKGRGDKILSLEKKFKKLGLKTYFHICGDRWLINKHKKYYKPVLSYTEYLKIASKGKAILNIMPEGQEALTLRDFEVVFNGVKGITNNKWIKNSELYDKSRFFILGIDKLKDLPEFISSPFKEIPEDILKKYTEDYYLEQILKLNS